MSVNSSSIPTTLGALQAGCLFAVALSGVAALQTFLYYRSYPQDAIRYKVMVAWLWLLDATNTVLISVVTWQYLIITIVLTAASTLSVNLFYCHRVYKLSGDNWHIAAPIILLSVARLALSIVSTVKMTQSHTWDAFEAKYQPIFTSGLALSAFTDIVIAVTLCLYLQSQRKGLAGTREMVDAIIVVTVNNGALTCVVAVASLICWAVMPHNLVFMGLHFSIGKLYTNSLLATLNMRHWLRHRSRSSSQNTPEQLLQFTNESRGQRLRDSFSNRFAMRDSETAVAAGDNAVKPVEINVRRTTEASVTK
ncbi:hypothetical protein EVG20_g2116 [Dentipellis fragilis]|uniref:DUF6534 domain-containing protein n=1 Tax=Dentipellis fragilis TaxID=205917 RepID=A0A4Y9Z8W2_9AGAM|nr:hypothetical protein EVG20_g2116 [Dentipellis fragilis]